MPPSALPPVDPRQPDAVLRACLEAWHEPGMGPTPDFLREGIQWVVDTFAGQHPDFEPLDTPYHDLAHTLLGTLCLQRLLAAWIRHHPAETAPDPHAVRIATLAILLHDTGYLKARGDTSGTGAKHTRRHVDRSALVAARRLRELGHPEEDVRAVQDMIRRTSPQPDGLRPPFPNPLLRRLGDAIGAADLLSQMADPEYPDKLRLLHVEFLEAERADPDPFSPPVPTDLDAFLQGTPDFWLRVARPRLEDDFGNVHRLLDVPWPGGPNPYLIAIEQNLRRL